MPNEAELQDVVDNKPPETVEGNGKDVDWEQMDKALFGQETEDEPGSGDESETDADDEQGTEGDDGIDIEAETGSGEDAAIDYDLLVPMPDGPEGGAPVKLGDLKNELIDFRRRDTAMHRLELDLANERRVLEAAVANGGQITPELRQQMAQQQAQRLENSAREMFDRNPSWQDPATFAKAQQDLAKVARSLGYTDREIQAVSDPRTVETLKEIMYWRRKAEAASAVRKEVKKPTRRIGSKPTRKYAKKTNAQELFQNARTSDGNVDWGALDKGLGLDQS